MNEDSHLEEAYEDLNGSPEEEIEEEEDEELEGFERILDAKPSSLRGFDEEAYEAYYDNQANYWDENDTDEFWNEFVDAYQGTWSSDEDFAQDMAKETGLITGTESWPHDCIDWTHAARELMYDYFESGGYYFCNH